MDIKFYEGIKKSLIEFLIVITSLSVIIFYLYWRISRKQPEIILVIEEIQKHYAVFLYFFILNGFILILLLISIYIKKRLTAAVKNEFGGFRTFFIKIDKIVSAFNIFYKAYTVVFHFINPDSLQPVVAYAGKIINFSKRKSRLIMIIFVVLPRVLISIIFIYEIYRGSLHFYFYSLLLLLISLLFRFILFVYSDIDKQVLPKLNELVERAPSPEKITLTINGKTETFGTIGFRFKPEFAFNEHGHPADIDHFMFTFYNPMLFIGPHMEVYIMPLYNKYNTLTVLIYLSIQVMGWGYIIFLL